MSRAGRGFLRVELLMEKFSVNSVRFIAINDGIDSTKNTMLYKRQQKMSIVTFDTICLEVEYPLSNEWHFMEYAKLA